MKKPKTIVEALEITLSTVKELKKEGVKVDIMPHTLDPEGNVEVTVTSKNLPIEKWCHVGLRCFTPTQQRLLQNSEDNLHKLGISFDTGSGFGQRDWELDWSFALQK